MVDRARFVEEWSDKVTQGNASLFVGAGISMGAGYPSWKRLLNGIAQELGLDIDQENDLAAVAQFYINKDRGRGRLTQFLAKQFPPKPIPPVLRVVARLPIRHVWTTNWDELIEAAFRDIRREPDIKEVTSDLTYERPDAGVVVYKMHGSVRHLDDVVLATDDFELYRLQREAFLRVLSGHLITTSFLFIGVSFTDPNLGHLLANIREMYKRYAPDKGGQPHYAILRRPQRVDFDKQDNADQKYKTASVRHALFVDDLRRYNVHCVEVDDHAHVEAMLRDVELRVAMRSVFVSGSLAAGSLPPDRADYVRAIAYEVGRAIALSDKRLVSGYGLGLGDQVLSGMLSTSWLDTTSNLDRRITIRPFPQQLPPGVDKAAHRTRYREDLVAQGGCCIAVCGIRASQTAPGAFEVGPGVLEEISIAQKFGRVIVPIGATGGAAEEAWKIAVAGPEDPRVPRGLLALLGDPSASPAAIGQAILDFLKHL